MVGKTEIRKIGISVFLPIKELPMKYAICEWYDVKTATNELLKTWIKGCDDIVGEVYRNDLPRALLECLALCCLHEVPITDKNLKTIKAGMQQLQDVGYIGSRH